MNNIEAAKANANVCPNLLDLKPGAPDLGLANSIYFPQSHFMSCITPTPSMYFIVTPDLSTTSNLPTVGSGEASLFDNFFCLCQHRRCHHLGPPRWHPPCRVARLATVTREV